MKKILLLLFLLGCSKPIEYTEFGKPIEVMFCPAQDCELKIIQEIDSAKHNILCSFYHLSSTKIINKLEQMQLKVSLVIDNKNKINSSLDIIYDNDNQLMHNKFCIIDYKKIITGSFNPTENNKNLNNIVIINSAYLANNYDKEFNELQKKEFGKGKKTIYSKIKFNNIEIESLFCPEDNCQNKIVSEILKSHKSIHFMHFSFTDKKIADALLFSNSKIMGIVDKTQSFQKYSQFDRLKSFELDINRKNLPHFLHHKVFIIDKKTVITGSYNPTLAGSFKNDENILIIRNQHIARQYLAEFYRIYNKQ